MIGLRVPLTNASKTAVQVGSIADVRDNTTVQITCPVSGLPWPDITWSKDSQQVAAGGRYSIDPEGGMLTITRLVPKDSGQYTCTAVNFQGQAQISGSVNVIGECHRHTVISVGTKSSEHSGNRITPPLPHPPLTPHSRRLILCQA